MVFRSPQTPSGLDRRTVLAVPAVAVSTLVLAAIVTSAAGVPLRDPGDVSVKRFTTTLVVVAIAALADRLVRGTRWTPGRAGAVLLALVSFYATYFAYRNLKSVVPLLRPGDGFDAALTDLDHDLFAGTAPATALQDLLGTGAAPLLSDVYMFFFAYIPLALVAGLVGLRRLRAGFALVTALALNWLLAAGGYFLLPSLGPFHAEPERFAALPATAVTALQDKLVAERAAFLADPAAAGAAQSIGAFPSLHVSVYVTVALAAHVLGLPRIVRAVAWVAAALTVVSTLYFGWHYVIDDVAGAVIAVLAVLGACRLTGEPSAVGRPRRLRRRVPSAVPGPEAA